MVGFTSEIWKFLALWSLPITLNNAPIFESCLAAYQANVIEPIYLASSSSTTQFSLFSTQDLFPIVGDKNLEFATMNVRAYNSPVKSEMEIEFDALTQQGHGGFFTKIAGMIGEGLGIKGSAQFADSVARIIDI